jgi:putative acetyltransferase
MHIRKATAQDISRIAEILVFVKRINFRPIFKNDDYSFIELQVLPVVQEYSSPDILEHIWVYDDGIVKGMIHIQGAEIRELYVDYFFQNQGIGAELIEFAKSNFPVRFLWAIEKNTGAIRFYENHGFYRTDTRKLEAGTTEYLILLVLAAFRDYTELSGLEEPCHD